VLPTVETQFEKGSKIMHSFRVLLPAIVLLSFSASAVAADGPASPVTVDFSDQRQLITGFGASGGNDSAANFRKMTPENQTKLNDLFFDQEKGIGLTMLRSELFARIEPKPGVWDWNKDDDQVWLMKEAQKRGVRYFWSANWSAPAWMKDNKNVNHGGHVLPTHYQDFADFLSRYAREYKTRFGIEIQAISMSNEPDMNVDYQSCLWSGEQMRDFLKNNLGPTFARDHVKAKIIVPEVSSWPALEIHADAVMADARARQIVDIVASHQYDQTFETQQQPKLPPAELLARYEPRESYGKQLWETEVSFIGGKPDPSIQWGLGTALLIHNAMVGAEVNAWHWWALLNNWGDNEGLADLAGDHYILTKRLFALGNYSKFVRPGFHMTAATHTPQKGVFITAFRDAKTERFAIVAINDTSEAEALQFEIPGYQTGKITPWVTSAALDLAPQAVLASTAEGFSATLAPKSVTTFAGEAVKEGKH